MARRILLLLSLLILLAACTTQAAPTATPKGPDSVVTPQEPDSVQINVYFTDSKRFAAGALPFEVAVTRSVPADTNLPEAALSEFFKGPTPEERASGLEAITSGFTGYRALQVQNGIARLYLNGPCASNGATYTVAQPLIKNLLQFAGINYVKIYDADGATSQPEGESNSIPFCLEP